MDTPLASNIINLFVAIGTIGAVIVALVGIWLNRRQARNDWLHAQQLATEERQHQSRPILVPVEELTPATLTVTQQGPGAVQLVGIHMADGLVNWSYPNRVNFELQNLGGGVALNVHCILYGGESLHSLQFVSWDNGPIGKDKYTKVYCAHSQQLQLNPDDSIDGSHPLYDSSLDSPSKPAKYRIACLTITYHDLFGIKHASIFNYTLDHRWVRVAIEKVPSLNGKPPLDLKELNDHLIVERVNDVSM